MNQANVSKDQTDFAARWLNGPVEHEAHHNGSEGNFALYFSFWDRLMGTRFKSIGEPTASAHASNKGWLQMNDGGYE